MTNANQHYIIECTIYKVALYLTKYKRHCSEADPEGENLAIAPSSLDIYCGLPSNDEINVIYSEPIKQATSRMSGFAP